MEGVDDGGEPIKAFRPTGHPGLWIVMGPFANVRFFSKYLVRVSDIMIRRKSENLIRRLSKLWPTKLDCRCPGTVSCRRIHQCHIREDTPVLYLHHDVH